MERLPYRGPLEAAALIDWFRARAVPGVEEVTAGDVYRRSLRLARGNGTVELRAGDGHVEARYVLDDDADLPVAIQRTRALLDLDGDPARVEEALGSDPAIGRLVRARPGLRVPGSVDGDELAARAVLGQQVSLRGAATLAGRLVADLGQPLARPLGAVTHAFPTARAIAAADPDSLAMPSARRAALTGLAAALASGAVTLDPDADRDETRRRLLALPGVGPWTAGYIALRALGDPDVFLSGDLGVRHALERLGCDGRPAAAARLAERWRPYRSYAMQHLWGLAL